MGDIARRYHVRNITMVLVMISLSLSYLMAGTTGKIMGTVIDQGSGEPLVGVNVVINQTTKGAITDSDGYYFILNIPPGIYSVTTSYIGFSQLTQENVPVTVDHTTLLDFGLTQSSIEGEVVTVIADRPLIETDVTGSQTVLSIGFLERAPIADLDGALRQQAGILNTGETSFIRGGLSSEVHYIMDGTSLNSGLISDNYARINMTAVQEISIMTGGYNAEYGQAMSGIVNVISKDPSITQRGVHGSFKYRMRPPGVYHQGGYMYDQDMILYSYYDSLNVWQQKLDQNAAFYADYFERWYGEGTPTDDATWDGDRIPTAQECRDLYFQQLDPAKVLGDYNKRSEQELEGSIYGSLSNNMSFLLSGRYKEGVNIFPQALPFNPEYNIQGKLTYHISPEIRLRADFLHGYYKSAGYTESNWNNTETSQEAGWQPNSEVRHPYWDWTAFSPWGAVWMKGPQEKNFNMGSLNWHQSLSPATFYTVQLSYISDLMTEKQDYSRYTWDTDQLSWGEIWYDISNTYIMEARHVRLGNWSDSKVLTAKTDLTTQLRKAHQIKTGVEFRHYDLDYKHHWLEFPSGDVWHLDNVFSGKPIEFMTYLQDKIEYQHSGIIANLGIRFEGFNTRKNYAESLYDPLGRQPWNGGDGASPSNTAEIWFIDEVPNDWFMLDTTLAYYEVDGEIIRGYTHIWPDSLKNDKNTVASEWKLAFAPRLGISFPITENSKLRFNYGHFYQRPSWSKLMGFPISWNESDPIGSVMMDQWMGWYGQPGLGWERTIQYEIGFAQNIKDILRLDLVGYYKDASGLTRFGYGGTYNSTGGFADTWSGSPQTFSIAQSSASPGHDNAFYTNSAYRDMRGFEATVEKLFNGIWSAALSFDYGLTTGGNTGYWLYEEDTTGAHDLWGSDEQRLTWLSNYVLKGDLNFVTPENWGPLGVLGGIQLGLYSEYFAGPQYTWYPTDYTELQKPNNKRWYPHIRTDMKLVKRIPIGSVTSILGIEVYNLFSNYDRSLLGGDDLDQWEVIDEETGEPKHQPPQASPESNAPNEDDIWWFYNSVSNPRRMVYVNLSIEF